MGNAGGVPPAAAYHPQMDRYDLVVVGAGAAGEAAAHYARSRDASVAIIDRGALRRLVPVLGVHAVQGAAPRGRGAPRRRRLPVVEGVGLPRLHDQPRGDRHARRLRPHEVARGRGRDRHPRARPHSTARAGSASRTGVLEAGAVVLAVGSVSRVPTDLPGLAEAHPWTNVEGTSTRELPRSLAILGAGPTGVELAQVYARYGVPVTLVPPARPRARQGASTLVGAAGQVARGRWRHAEARFARHPRASRRGRGRRARHRARRWRGVGRGPRDPARHRPRLPARRPRPRDGRRDARGRSA